MTPVLRDPEVLELLAGEAELLAIADVVSATQLPSRRPLLQRRLGRVGLVAALAVVAVGVALVLPKGNSGIVDRALAAIGAGPVMHVIADMPTGVVDVNLRSGQRTASTYRLELWADRDFKRFHIVMSYRGKTAVDVLYPQDAKQGASVGTVDPAFAALWIGYRQALATGKAKVVRKGTAYGRPVYWLRFKAAAAKSAPSEVAVDAKTFKPVVYRIYSGSVAVDQHILLAETIPFSTRDFTRRGPAPQQSLSVGGGSSSSSGSSTTPSTVVPRGWLVADETIIGQKLASVEPFTTTTRHTTVHGIRLIYGRVHHGANADDATTIEELRNPDDPRLWAHIPPGVIEIQQGQTSTSSGHSFTTWTGNLRSHHHYVTITSTRNESTVIAIAKSLRLMP
jgi:hypothetical protein